MSKATKRVTDGIVITYQMTESRAERFNEVIKLLIAAAISSPYPHEFVTPQKGDFINVSLASDKANPEADNE